MNADLIRAWLRKKKKWGFAQHELLGVTAFVAGLAILFFTFWFTYAVIWFGWYGISAAVDLCFSKKLHLSHEIRLLGSGLFVVLLFVQHLRTASSHWGDYPQRNYRSAPGLALHAGAVVGLAVMLAYPGASANMVADILLVGPRLVMGSFGLVRKGFRLKKLDENGCGELIAFLHSQPKAVSYEELKSAGWEEWLEQLHDVKGVQFLQNGLILNQELREELGALLTN
jgi:hypothetical protein